MDLPQRAFQVAVPVALAVSLLVVRRLDRPRGRWGRRLRSRLLLGVPWGTATTVVLVAAVYLGLQGGFSTPRSPLHLPFTSWSYLYPLGVLTAPFSHQSLGHVTGNLLGTIVLAPLAEYAFSHFPTERGSSTFATWRTNPYVRAFLVFPAGVLAVGLLTSVFAWGPIIGFSGVVFAFAGFALVRYPMATVVALVARDMVGTLYHVLRDPIVTGSASSSFGPPWWAGIAIQGHLLGFLLGATVAAALVSGRSKHEIPSALRLWTGAVFVGSNMTLWAVWWYREGGYVLYRGAGLVLVVVLALLLATIVRAGDEPIPGGLTKRQLGIVALLFPILTMGFVAVPLNATMIDEPEAPEASIEVNDYTLTYATQVTDPRSPAINETVVGETAQINASGVIVTSDRRSLWTEAISAGQLAYDGERVTKVGGVGWSRSVTAIRDGWRVVGNATVYQVALRPAGENATWVYASSPKRAEPKIAGQTVTIRPDNGTFTAAVATDDGAVEKSGLPAQNESVTIGNLTLTTEDDRLFAETNDTRVRVATRETYE
ncbi:rhomboid family intramembrane serine protease [Halanaeroarchaeum sulfurireducens]|uniref:Rhomboid family protein n=1 Tax=Halanaeroarchaeum sulfurireducens TaxID=1604004 RepID=A0A0F7P9J8_9EURY|nr:rhomboid family intramembrane serine protease [Halanaeroarchaeum sulfurireducens]AKH97811.1 rhomboid family protein [Halanaeroarchaeum sulfurireducens]